jgi:hypothetical protein
MKNFVFGLLVGAILMFGVSTINWSTKTKPIEEPPKKEIKLENTAFRNIQVTGENGYYMVTGEARVFEAVMSYAVFADSDQLFEKHHNLVEGAPSWSPFSLEIQVTKQQLAGRALAIKLFEYSAKDGSKANVLKIPIE